ncbi:MAG: amidase [Deltaproteobacteria bacterium]|nr:amidase [Deltaproteobacteria bacterium]
MASELLTVSGSELARRIRRGELSSSQAVDVHIEQVRRVNPALNALVRDRFSHARAEARAADAHLAESREDLPPFFGVPCSIKESFALTGMPQTAGLVSRRGRLATSDAPAVARLRAAGAIPIGVTNVSELCMWLESDNAIYGRSRNPYDPARIVGGSSGGEGALVSAGGSPFGLGADVGGSIRMPAFFNGVFGHKPSVGLVPNTGQFPQALGPAGRLLGTGPICRRAEDLWPLLEVLAGPDGRDPACREMALGEPGSVRIDALRVLDVRGDGRHPVSDELLAAQDRACRALAARGATIEPARFEGLARGFFIWAARMSANAHSYRQLLGGDGPPVRPVRELARWALGRSPHTLPSLGLALLEQVPLSESMRQGFLEAGRALGAALGSRLGERCVMLYPSHPRPAPRHAEPLLHPFDWIYTGIFNALELPVSQVPLGLGRAGLPLGVQVVGADACDHVTVAVALALERDLGGWVPPWEADQGSPSCGSARRS